jgi:hypothetical protein
LSVTWRHLVCVCMCVYVCCLCVNSVIQMENDLIVVLTLAFVMKINFYVNHANVLVVCCDQPNTQKYLVAKRLCWIKENEDVILFLFFSIDTYSFVFILNVHISCSAQIFQPLFFELYINPELFYSSYFLIMFRNLFRFFLPFLLVSKKTKTE